MLKEITIKNFKSIANDTIELGRVNVFIGENGCGKSNILEAVGFASAYLISKDIEKDILASKGVRIAKPSLMVNSFKKKKQVNEIQIKLHNDKNKEFTITSVPDKDDIHSAKWLGKTESEDLALITENLKNLLGENRLLFEKTHDFQIKGREFVSKNESRDPEEFEKDIQVQEQWKDQTQVAKEILKGLENFRQEIRKINEILEFKNLSRFLIFCLNTPALRGLTHESKQDPVGIFGEKLDTMIANFDHTERNELNKYKYIINWLEDFLIDIDDLLKFKGFKQNLSQSRLYFSDKFMKKNNNIFSSENANEGILHILFYLSILISKKTPKIFAIDNIESCLNPHLCRHLMEEICKLAKSQDKQLLITTHNPAILDGLNLFDDEIRLFEVNRTDKGYTKTTRIKVKPEIQSEMGRKYKLSELWTRGFLGTTPDYF